MIKIFILLFLDEKFGVWMPAFDEVARPPKFHKPTREADLSNSAASACQKAIVGKQSTTNYYGMFTIACSHAVQFGYRELN